MFNNIGRKLRIWTYVLLAIGFFDLFAWMTLGAIYDIFYICLIAGIVTVFNAIILAFLIYGFSHLITSVDEIKNTIQGTANVVSESVIDELPDL